jgi:hypothetical protein
MSSTAIRMMAERLSSATPSDILILICEAIVVTFIPRAFFGLCPGHSGLTLPDGQGRVKQEVN